jgi:hypothetical protein
MIVHRYFYELGPCAITLSGEILTICQALGHQVLNLLARAFDTAPVSGIELIVISTAWQHDIGVIQDSFRHN